MGLVVERMISAAGTRRDAWENQTKSPKAASVPWPQTIPALSQASNYSSMAAEVSLIRGNAATLWRMAMRAIEAKTFSGYGGLRQIELPKPQPTKDRVLVHVTAAGVTPLDHTILSGGHPRAKAPLVLGNEGAGVIEDAGDSGLAVGSRVMFTGPYGVAREWRVARMAAGET